MERRGSCRRNECSDCRYDFRGRSSEKSVKSLTMLVSEDFGRHRTCGGPSMVPFQFVMRRSSPSDSPYEQASTAAKKSATSNRNQLMQSFSTSPKTFLAFLQLFQKSKVSGHFRTHSGGCGPVTRRIPLQVLGLIESVSREALKMDLEVCWWKRKYTAGRMRVVNLPSRVPA